MGQQLCTLHASVVLPEHPLFGDFKVAAKLPPHISRLFACLDRLLRGFAQPGQNVTFHDPTTVGGAKLARDKPVKLGSSHARTLAHK